MEVAYRAGHVRTPSDRKFPYEDHKTVEPTSAARQNVVTALQQANLCNSQRSGIQSKLSDGSSKTFRAAA